MSSSEKNIRKPESEGLTKDELADDRADERSAAEFSLFGGDLSEAAAEAAAANQLAPEENAPEEEEVKFERRRPS